MNAHDELKILISAYYDGAVSSEEKQQVEAHLQGCAACRKYLLELQILSSSLRKWSNEAPSPDLEKKINNRISTGRLKAASTGFHNLFGEAGKKGEPMQTSTLKFSHLAGSLVILALLAVISLQTMSQRSMQARVRDASRYLSERTELAANKPQPVEKKNDQLALLKDKAAALYGTKGRLKSATDDIGDQYSPDNTHVTERTQVTSSTLASAVPIGKTSQYEPYYLETDYKAPAEMQVANSGQEFWGSKEEESVRKRASGGFQASTYDSERRDDLPVPAAPPAIYPYKQQPYSTKDYNESIVMDMRQPQPVSNTEGYDRIYENAFLEAPTSIFRRVDLPAPLGPTRTVRSPRSTSKSIP